MTICALLISSTLTRVTRGYETKYLHIFYSFCIITFFYLELDFPAINKNNYSLSSRKLLSQQRSIFYSIYLSISSFDTFKRFYRNIQKRILNSVSLITTYFHINLWHSSFLISNRNPFLSTYLVPLL